MPSKRPDSFRGNDLTSPLNRMPPGKVALGVNVRAYLEGGFAVRNSVSAPLFTVDSSLAAIRRLNDTTPAGPVDGYIYVIGTDSGSVFADSTKVASGLTGNPISIVPFRPNTSVQPWAYIGDSQASPLVTVDSSFNCSGMIKVRSDGLSRKTGVKEPSEAPVVTFPGGGTGASLVYYYYTYRASETGAVSNPSPVSIPGTNAKSGFTHGDIVPDDITYNHVQWETAAVSPNQLRTTGSATLHPQLLDPVIAGNFNLSVPAGLDITGVSVDLNWVAQADTNATVQSVQLYYRGSPLGGAKNPGTQVQTFNSDVVQGGITDLWGTTLTPAIVNDPTFGFSVQIAVQTIRVFLNSFTVTVYANTQNAVITPSPSADPQVDKIDFYRQSGGLANPTYVGTGPNSATPFNDLLSDLAASINPVLDYDNFEPYPSIDLPRSGTLNVDSTQTLTWASGDHFNIRWLPGTVILIGSPDQVAYTAIRRPDSTTSWRFANNDPNVPVIPQGSGLQWNIAEPALAQQPLPYQFGPTDNINYTFAVGDPLRPGTLYWCKGSNLDSAPDTNQLEVTDPSEPLVNGVMTGGVAVLHSIRRAWFILPNFFNALATVTGTQGSTWTLQATSINRGLFMPWCLAVEGGGNYFFRVDDGIHYSVGGAQSVSVTDEDLYPLFPHESTGAGTSVPQAITRNGYTIYPPDDSLPQKQKFSIQNAYLYYDHIATDGKRHTWVLDIRTLAWIWDNYNDPPTAHAPNEGQSQQGTVVGCLSGAIRLMTSAAAENFTASVVTPAIGGIGWMTAYEMTVEYACDSGMTASFIAADEGNGSYAPTSITLPATAGQITKFTAKLSANKWKLLQMRFDTADPTAQVYQEGCVLEVKPFGSDGLFTPINMFHPSGGKGAQA